MCNCTSSPASICNQCAQGNPCGCPPDYTIMPLPCKCCPPGYYDNGIDMVLHCIPIDSNNPATPSAIPGSPCNTCVDSVPSDCVILPAVPCLGLSAGTTLTQLANYLCSPSFIQVLLTTIGLNPGTLGVDFCQLVQACPPTGGGTTPVIVHVTFHTP